VTVATSLGSADIVLMRRHGVTIVGQNVRQTVYRSISAELNARLQVTAMGLGEPTYLTPTEAVAAAATTESQVDRPWALWRAAACSGVCENK
jgi:HCOMODA/2-hydroxy-3-carboxy-muconic semialdehyde decarboxylase